MSGRESVIQSAVDFLKDPRVQSSPLANKVAFLEKKGLTSQEIEEAMSRANGKQPTQNQNQNQNYPMMPPPLPPPLPPQKKGLFSNLDWKDMFIGLVVAGGVVYGGTLAIQV